MAVRHRRRVHGVRGGRARPVRADQGAPERAARRLGRAQRPLRQGRARDRHRRLGLLRRQHRQRATPTSRPSSRAPSRSCGAGPATTAFRDDLYDFSRRALRYVADTLDADKDGWPEGLGNVEREGMGEEKLDNAVYLIRGLYDLADMARGQARRRHGERGRTTSPPSCAPASTRTWWDEPSIQYADSLEARTTRSVQQQHWIGVTPMEAELPRRAPALAPPSTPPPRSPSARRTASAAAAPFNRRPVPHRLRGRPGGQGRADRLLAQHRDQGRRRRQLRPLASSAATPTPTRHERCPTSSPARCPEILPSPDSTRTTQHRPLLDLPRDVHAGLGPLRHRLAGDPPAARRAARRSGAAAWTSCRTSRTGQTLHQRRGDPARRRRPVAVRAERDGQAATRRRSRCAATHVRALRVGATLPHGPRPRARLRSTASACAAPERPSSTNRGVEVAVPVARPQGRAPSCTRGATRRPSGPWPRAGRARRRRRPRWPGRAARRCRARASPSGRGRASRGRRWRRRRAP